MATKKAATPAKTTTKKAAAPKATATKATKPAVKAKSAEKKVVSKVKDIEALIRRRAEEIYHARVAKGVHGTPESDWIQAEKEVKAKKK